MIITKIGSIQNVKLFKLPWGDNKKQKQIDKKMANLYVEKYEAKLAKTIKRNFMNLQPCAYRT